MNKLIILPSFCNSLGGSTVSLSMTIAGFARLQKLDRICVPVQSGSLLENYLRHLGQEACLQPIAAGSPQQFYQRALNWVSRQPRSYPLVLENCTSRYLIVTLGRNIPRLKLSGLQIYHVFRDLATSHNWWGKWLRKSIFTSLNPGAICNSQFTAQSVARHLGLKLDGILYPPVDRQRFSDRPLVAPPKSLEPILAAGAKIMLTPSRIGEPGQINDKNLRGVVLALAQLKKLGYYYHSVIVGQDYSPDKAYIRGLLELAEQLAVAERLTILPPTFAIEDYYQYADLLVTLAPREPFGRTVTEAIACGVPVVGSNTGGINEILHNFAPQWTVDPNETAAVVRTILRLAESDTASVLRRGQEWVEAHCSPVEYAKKLVKIVDLDPVISRQQTTSTLAAN